MINFDERVHLAVIGDGFIRTPFLSGTKEAPRYVGSDVCSPIGPNIVHIPAAGRKSGLNLANPNFRRAVFTSDLCERITREESAQLNQENVGVSFKFHKNADRNIARAHISDKTLLRGTRTLVLESSTAFSTPIQFNELNQNEATTSFLAFLDNYWTDLRHVDSEILQRHFTPLHFDLDFTFAYLTEVQPFTVNLPIYGDVRGLTVFERSEGITTASTAITLTEGGTAEILSDSIGGKYLRLFEIPPLHTLNICLTNDAGEVFSRSICLLDEFPTQKYIFLPAGLCGVPYECSIPLESAYFSIDCNSYNLPKGLHFSDDHTIHGVPVEYGTNFSFVGHIAENDGTTSAVKFIITINRPQRDLLVISDNENNDKSSGEYYACLSQPFGSCLEYGGKVWQFKRYKSMGEPWPFVEEIPYSYLSSGRLSTKATEEAWKEV